MIKREHIWAFIDASKIKKIFSVKDVQKNLDELRATLNKPSFDITKYGEDVAIFVVQFVNELGQPESYILYRFPTDIIVAFHRTNGDIIVVDRFRIIQRG